MPKNNSNFLRKKLTEYYRKILPRFFSDVFLEQYFNYEFFFQQTTKKKVLFDHDYKQLPFSVENFFLVGSPVGLFLAGDFF